MDTRVVSSMHVCVESLSNLFWIYLFKTFPQRFVLRVRIYSSTKYIICIDSMQEKELERVEWGRELSSPVTSGSPGIDNYLASIK